MTEANDDCTLDPARWVDLHGDALFRYARARVRTAEQAVDLVQEAFLHALRARDSYAGSSSERTWLVGIIRHKILDYYRKAARERTEEFDESTFFDERGFWKLALERGGGGPSGDLERGEFWESVDLCRRALPSKLAAAFTLRELDGQASEAVCEALAITPANLWARLHRARLLLAGLPPEARVRGGPTMIGRIRSGWRLMNLPCSEVARLASESLDHELPRSSLLALRSHLVYCSACRRYARDIRRMRAAMQVLASLPAEEEPGLPDEARERIKRTLGGG